MEYQKSHYEILGVPRDASAGDIRLAFRRLAAQHHPDREGGDPELMAAINRAWETLGDVQRRAEYDATGGDNAADDFERECRDRLVAVFEGLLESADHVDIALAARTTVTATLTELRGQDDRQKAQIAKLHRQRDRVRRKAGGDNLFTGLVDSKIADLTKARERTERGRKVFERVRDMLQEYEGVAMQPSSQQTQLATLIQQQQALLGPRGTPQDQLGTIGRFV